MDFDKVLSQRQAKASATTTADAIGEKLDGMTAMIAGTGKPGPKPKATSKRNDPDWVAFTAFMQKERRAEVQRYINLISLLPEKEKAKFPADQSEMIEEALAAYLRTRLPKLEEKTGIKV